MATDLLLTRSSALPLETVCQRLTEVAVSHKFGVLATHNLREKMGSSPIIVGEAQAFHSGII